MRSPRIQRQLTIVPLGTTRSPRIQRRLTIVLLGTMRSRRTRPPETALSVPAHSARIPWEPTIPPSALERSIQPTVVKTSPWDPRRSAEMGERLHPAQATQPSVFKRCTPSAEPEFHKTTLRLEIKQAAI